jgi:hypothetical protein
MQNAVSWMTTETIKEFFFFCESSNAALGTIEDKQFCNQD